MGPLDERWARVADLVTSRVIRARLGWKEPSAISQRVKGPRVGFPQSVATLSRTHIWVWPDVEEWCVQNGKEFLSGTDRVAEKIVVERLGLDAESLERFGEESPVAGEWLWGDAERAWHRAANAGVGRSPRDVDSSSWAPDRLVRIGDLVSVGMIRARLGLKSVRHVHHLVDSDAFPPAIVSLSRNHIWLWSDVIVWCGENDRPFLEPESVVSSAEVLRRLGMDGAALSRVGVLPEFVLDGVAQWKWADVEAGWLVAANDGASREATRRARMR